MRLVVYKTEKPFFRTLLNSSKRLTIKTMDEGVAKIDVFNRVLYVNKNLNKLDDISKLAVFLHELAHNFYWSEHKCDAFAAAIIKVFFKKQNEEIINVFDSLLKNKKRVNKLKEFLKKYYNNGTF